MLQLHHFTPHIQQDLRGGRKESHEKGQDSILRSESRTFHACLRTSMLQLSNCFRFSNLLILTFWRRNYFFNFSTPVY